MSTTENTSSKNLQQTCPECGNVFGCGIANGERSCWCFALPNVLPVDATTSCLCPACLRAKIAEYRPPPTDNHIESMD